MATECKYVINPNIKSDTPADEIIVCDKERNHQDNGGGGNLLFMDGRVRYASIDDLKYQHWLEAFIAGDKEAATKGPKKWINDQGR